MDVRQQLNGDDGLAVAAAVMMNDEMSTTTITITTTTTYPFHNSHRCTN
jgi:hypothetical protein